MKSYNLSKIKSIKKIKVDQDCYDLTIDKFSRYFGNDILVHNTDGQNIMISWKKNKLIAARSKKHLRNAGQDALDAKSIDTLFAGRGDISIAFNAAMTDLTSAISVLSPKDHIRFFNEGSKFASLEIITPITQNSVPYGLNMLVFHGIIEYDVDGNAIDEDKQAGRDIGKLIDEANAASQKTFYIRGPHDLEIKPFPNTAKRASYYENKYKSILKETKLGPASTVKDYVLAMGRNILLDEANKSKVKLTENSIDGLVNRLGGISNSYSISMIKKDLGMNADWYIDLEKSRGKEIYKNIYAPLENLFLEVGTELMKNMTSFLSANPTVAAEEMRKEIEAVINKVKLNGGAKEVEKLEHELKRITAAGGLDSISPTEGITFIYKGKLYKYTGLFAPFNQIRGMLVYKK